MQNAVGVAQAPHDQNDAYRAVVSDLVSLVEHVQNSLRLIERMIARETSTETSAETSAETSPGSSESSTNVTVLDDVSPRYMKAASAVQACDVNLGIALRSLLDSGDNDPCASSPPALSVWRPSCHRTASEPDAATTMEKLDAALSNMSHGLCMFGPDNRLLLWNDRYVKMYKLAPDRRRVGSTLDEMLEARKAAGTAYRDLGQYGSKLRTGTGALDV